MQRNVSAVTRLLASTTASGSEFSGIVAADEGTSAATTKAARA